MLVLSRKKNEEIIITVGDETIRISMVGIESHRARVGIQASKNVAVVRAELVERDQARSEQLAD